MFLFMFAAPVPVIRLPGWVSPHVWSRSIVVAVVLAVPTCLLLAVQLAPDECVVDGKDINISEVTIRPADDATGMCSGSGDTTIQAGCLAVSATELAVGWGILTTLAFSGAAAFFAVPSVRPFWGSFFRAYTYRRFAAAEFQRTEPGEGGTSPSFDLEFYLSSRDPYYWPPDLAATPLFQTVWPEWQASRPEWMTGEWESNVPPRFHEALAIVPRSTSSIGS